MGLFIGSSVAGVLCRSALGNERSTGHGRPLLVPVNPRALAGDEIFTLVKANLLAKWTEIAVVGVSALFMPQRCQHVPAAAKEVRALRSFQGVSAGAGGVGGARGIRAAAASRSSSLPIVMMIMMMMIIMIR